MRRVVVIGSGGSGKSTFAAALGARTGLPVVHLDRHYWQAGWVPTPADAWQRAVAAIVAGEAWIVDGNYSGTLDLRLARADTVVLLDLPRWLCLARVVGRWLQHLGRTRADMAPGCPERLTGEFLTWIWTYPTRRRPAILRRLAALPPTTRVVRLRSRRAVARFLQTLPA
jgi:adenylate kinase family enzyme